MSRGSDNIATFDENGDEVNGNATVNKQGQIPHLVQAVEHRGPQLIQGSCKAKGGDGDCSTVWHKQVAGRDNDKHYGARNG
eukprot:4850663-Prymnesium_polylepis.1